MQSILLDLNRASPNIEASAVISREGLVIAAALPQELNEDTIGAITAALISIGSRGAREFAGGSLELLMIKGSEGDILMTHAGNDTALAVVTKSHDELDFLWLQLIQASEKIRMAFN